VHCPELPAVWFDLVSVCGLRRLLAPIDLPDAPASVMFRYLFLENIMLPVEMCQLKLRTAAERCEKTLCLVTSKMLYKTLLEKCNDGLLRDCKA